jgi:hypothetical protein
VWKATWRNIDASPVLLASIALFHPLVPTSVPNVQYGDIVRGHHQRPPSCQAVLCCNTHEHLTYQGSLKALQSMFDLLLPSRVLRVIGSDLRRLVIVYLEHTADDGRVPSDALERPRRRGGPFAVEAVVWK